MNLRPSNRYLPPLVGPLVQHGQRPVRRHVQGGHRRRDEGDSLRTSERRFDRGAVLTTEAVVASKPEKTPDMAGGPGRLWTSSLVFRASACEPDRLRGWILASNESRGVANRESSLSKRRPAPGSFRRRAPPKSCPPAVAAEGHPLTPPRSRGPSQTDSRAGTNQNEHRYDMRKCGEEQRRLHPSKAGCRRRRASVSRRSRQLEGRRSSGLQLAGIARPS